MDLRERIQSALDIDYLLQRERALGDHDAALRWLERAFQARDFLCVVFPFEAMFNIPLPGQTRSIREDPRWTDLVRRVGLLHEPA